jgi:hypothetical protein
MQQEREETQMFGCIVSGRWVQTNPQRADTSKFIFVIEDATNVGDIVVFLLGERLPTGFSAGIFLSWNNQQGKILGSTSIF